MVRGMSVSEDAQPLIGLLGQVLWLTTVLAGFAMLAPVFVVHVALPGLTEGPRFRDPGRRPSLAEGEAPGPWTVYSPDSRFALVNATGAQRPVRPSGVYAIRDGAWTRARDAPAASWSGAVEPGELVVLDAGRVVLDSRGRPGPAPSRSRRPPRRRGARR